jgi:hypothetical protein
VAEKGVFFAIFCKKRALFVISCAIFVFFVISLTILGSFGVVVTGADREWTLGYCETFWG